MTCNCGKPTRDDAYVCDGCLTALARALGDVPWLVEQLEITMTKARGVDYSAMGGSASSETPLPVDARALEASRNLRHVLVTCVRFCTEEDIRHQSPNPNHPEDTIVAMSRWLLWRVDGLAFNDMAAEEIAHVTAATDRCWRVIDRPADKWYAGPCITEFEGIKCGTDLYAKAASGDVECRTCGATYDVAGRRKWLLDSAQDFLADAATLARSVSWLGAQPLNATRVRKWAERGRIVAKGHDGTRPLYRIGDAIDLLAKEAS